jgi:hypothetical protein
MQDQCIGGGGGAQCNTHGDCAPSEQCLSDLGMCIEKCNGDPLVGPLLCAFLGMTCDMGTGFCQ